MTDKELRELDTWIHGEILKRIVPVDHNIDDRHCDCVPRYTRDIADAFQVVEKFPYGFALHRPQKDDVWRCIVGIEPVGGDMERQLSITVEASKAPFAICLAMRLATKRWDDDK